MADATTAYLSRYWILNGWWPAPSPADCDDARRLTDRLLPSGLHPGSRAVEMEAVRMIVERLWASGLRPVRATAKGAPREPGG